MDLVAAGAAGEDIDITCTAGSVNITAGESAANSITITSSIGGIDISAAGAAAGEDIDITATGSSINLTSTENVANAIYLNASDAAGGIDMDCGTGGFALDVTSGAVSIAASTASDFTVADAGADLTLESTLGRVIVNAEEAAANAITLLSAAGGLDCDVALQLSLVSSQAAATAVVIDASDASGGIDIDDGGGGTTIDSAAGVSIDTATASNFTVADAGEDLTLASTLGRVIVNAEEAATNAITLLSAAGGLDVNTALEINIDSSEAAVADAIRIVASAADGGIDIDAGTGGIAIDSTGAISIAGAAASDFTVGGAGIDLTLESTLGRVIVNAEEAADNAITLVSAAGGIDADCALQLNLTSSEVAADAIVINASGGGVDITAATNDLDIAASTASVNISAAEAASDAIVIDASDAAGGVQIKSGTAGVQFDSGMIVNVTATNTAATPYSVLGSDYFITTDTTGGAMQVTLPAAPETGRTFIVYDGAGQAAAGGAVTISGGGKNIAVDGTSAATYVMNGAYESVTIVYNGTIYCGRLTA